MACPSRATASIAFEVVTDVLGGMSEGAGPVDALKGSPPSVLRKLCERMGATYIKVLFMKKSTKTL